MNKKHLLTLGCIVAILGSGVWIYLSSTARPRVELTPYRALGEVAAEETGRLLPQKGKVVIVTRENPGGEDQPLATQLEALNRALPRNGFSIAATETFTVPRTDLFARGSVPHDRFFQILQGHPGSSAFILLAALPTMNQADLDRLKQSGTKVVTICGFKPGDEALFRSGVLSLAIVPRTGAPPEGAKATGLRGVFETHYTILTPDKS